jgi:hypothetical protein
MKSFEKIILILFLCLNSCATKPIRLKKNVLILSSPNAFCFVKSFVEKDREYFYSYEVGSYKKAFIYTEKGIIIDTLDFSEFEIKNACDVIQFHIRNNDEMVLLANQNKIFLVDNQLNVLKEYNYINQYFMGCKLFPHVTLSQGDYFYTNLGAIYPVNPHFKAFSNEAHDFLHSQPVISKINVRTGDISLIGKGMIKRLLKNIHENYGFEKFHVINTHSNSDTYLYYSIYSDSIFEISENNSIKSVVKISSELGDIVLPKVTYKEMELNGGSSYVYKLATNQSFIDLLLNDPIRNLRYVIIRKPIDKKNNFPFNVLVYNNQWEKLDEIEFDSKKYRYNFFIAEKGLYIEKLNTNPASTVRKFDCLVYEKQGE